MGTEEVRDDKGIRQGFDVVSLHSDSRKPLAKTNPLLKGPKVGKYTVMVSDFEEVALPILSDSHASVLLIDEIGKMEMYSELFAPKIQDIFQKKDDCTILATIPNKVSSGPLCTLLDAL